MNKNIGNSFKDWTIEDIDLRFRPTRGMEKQELSPRWKTLYLKLLIIGIITLIFLSLINIQVINGDKYKKLSDNNRIYIEPIVAPRGIIYDRNGIPLAYNNNTFKLVVNKNIFDQRNETEVFAHIAKTTGTLQSKIESNFLSGTIKNMSSFILLVDNLTKEQMIEISSDPTMVKTGISVEPSIQRTYPSGELMSHILGYVGEASSADLASNNKLNNQDTIGKGGIEYTYDKQLRGVDGENIVEVNTYGQVVTVIKREDPISGNNLTLSIDINAQKQLAALVMDGIKNSGATGGASVIENSNDGSLLAMISLPSFDNNKFAHGISEHDYAALVADTNHPLIDRAIGEAQPPGSVMKTITGAAALQEKVINKNTTFYSGGTFDYGGHTFQDYDKIIRGDLNVSGGLQWSSNIFFYNTILKLGITDFVKYEKLFGVGTPTGIDLPGEASGEISSPQVKQELTGQVWYGGDSLNSAIGQGYTLVTPIQVSNWIGAIANGGTLFKPIIVEQIRDSNNKIIQNFSSNIVRQSFISTDNLASIKEGMHNAVIQGIDRTMYTHIVDIGGKTGTAEFGSLDQNGQYTHEHAWASGFVPYNNPQFSFVFFLEGGGLSSKAEVVAKNYFTWYYGDYKKNNANAL